MTHSGLPRQSTADIIQKAMPCLVRHMEFVFCRYIISLTYKTCTLHKLTRVRKSHLLPSTYYAYNSGLLIRKLFFINTRYFFQDFEALTPNLMARTIETVEGGGLIIFLLKSMNSLRQLHSITMDVHSR